jgi:CubicO group peptidase (beta-lactamase class C family)
VDRRRSHPIASAFRLGSLALVIGVFGALASSWASATDLAPAAGDPRFERIDAFVREEMRGARIPGIAIAIVEGGETVHATAFGHDGHGNAVTPDTPFWIGSNTKSMTALAVMQLVEDGLVELDAPVQRYLPEFRVADAAASSQITVRHLLHQTSGLARIDGLRAVTQTTDESLAVVVAGMRDLELNRPVGESFEYANLNSVVLGLLVERMVGQHWHQVVQSSIFDPLGMTRTFTSPELAGRQGVTANHRSAFGFPLRTEGRHIEGLASSGYVYSTAHDMARYLAAYVDGGAAGGRRVLSEAGVAAMLTLATNERTFPLQSQRFTAGYGAGWFVGRFGVADDARWHQGSLPHFTAWTVLLPDTDQAVVVLMNAGNQFEFGGANGAWSRIPQGIVNLLRGADPPAGIAPARFFGVFDALVALAVVGQAWSLVRVVRRRRALPTSMLARTAPLAWELIAAPLILIGYPAITGGLGWRTAFEFLPDLSLAVLVIAGLAILTGLVRAGRIAGAPSRPLAPSAGTAAAPPGAAPAGGWRARSPR